jgi:hypothetical protein
MTTYFRTTDGQLCELAPEQYAALAQSKKDILRLWVVDEQPVPGAGQVVVSAGIVVGPVEAHQTWTLRAMTAAELDAADLEAEKTQIAQLIIDVKTQLDIDNTAFNAMTTADKFVVLRQDRRLVLKGLRFLLRRFGSI